MGSTLVNTGDKVDNDDEKIVFVIGAYRLGPVYINREIITTAMHPGEGYTFPTGAGGEDAFLIFPDKSPKVAGIIELDKGMIDDCTDDYTIGNDVPGIQFHLNYGAILRNIQCVDPPADVDAWSPMGSGSGTAGSFIPIVEPTLATEADNLGFNAAASVGASGATGTTIVDRVYLRQMYFLTDPTEAYTDVMCISK